MDAYATNPKKLAMIASIVGEKKVTLSQGAFSRFASLLDTEPPETNLESVWILLGLNAPYQLGELLEANKWCWSADKSHFENVMGSAAVAATNKDVSFLKFANRLAPAKLLELLSEREFNKGDVRFAVELLNLVVMDSNNTPPSVRLEASHDREAANQTIDYLYTLGAIREEGDRSEDGVSFLHILDSGGQYEERRQTLAEEYFEEIKKVRDRGSQFYLEHLDPNHFDVVFKGYPDAVNVWLEGIEVRSPQFVRRVRLANGFYVSLCEAMLVYESDRGVELWRALRECMDGVRYAVFGDMDRLVHALFAATPSTQVESAMEEIFSIEQTRDDRELMGLLVAARLFDRLDWLGEKVARDESSPCPMLRKRAAFLRPMINVPEISGEEGWPEGARGGGIHGVGWRLAQREAFAYHWLKAFAEAESTQSAFAAWRLFLACVDRRAWSWMSPVLKPVSKSSASLEQSKWRFAQQQVPRIKQAMADNEKAWDKNFASQRFPTALSPWNERR